MRHLADIGDAGSDRVQRNEMRPAALGDQVRKRGFADARTARTG